MFLKVTTAKGGVIKGETLDEAHKGEIDLLSWSWGMHVTGSLGGGGPKGRASVHELKVVKRIDLASTALMSALRSNEVVVKAVLTLRKAAPNDSEFAYCAKRAAFREYVEKVWGWDEEEQRRLHEQHFGAQDFRVIALGASDIGILATVAGPDCVKVNQLFLLPEHQGKGIGRRCMLMIIEEARRLHLPVRLRVLKVNPRALAFYKRLGFTCTGETDTHDLMERRP